MPAEQSEPITSWVLETSSHTRFALDNLAKEKAFKGKLKPLDKAGVFQKVALTKKQFEAVDQLFQKGLIERRWRVDHMWPGQVGKPDFVEKAAQGLKKKFSGTDATLVHVQATFDGGSKLCSAVKGRLVQLLKEEAKKKTTKTANGDALHLFVLVNHSTLFASSMPYKEHGCVTGVHPKLKALIDMKLTAHANKASRASHKVKEAMNHLFHLGQSPSLGEGTGWIDLGSCPGGITANLATLGCRVLSIDRAAIQKEISELPKVEFVQTDANAFPIEKHVKKKGLYQGLACDMNGKSDLSARIAQRYGEALEKGAHFVFTLKLENVADCFSEIENCQRIFKQAKLELLSIRHLGHNRSELTLFLKKV